jgi:hypothetical protein
MILQAKQLDHLAQSNGLKSVHSEMSLAYQNEEVRHLAAATSLAWLAEEHLPTSIGNASSAEMSSGLQAQPVRSAGFR